MYQDVQKLSESQLEKDISLGNPVEGQGIRTMLGGTILREIAKYDGETAWWSMGGDFTGTNVNNPFTTGGYNFLAGLFGFEEKIPEIQGSKDSGYRKSVYVRWDLLCQIINQLCQDAIKDSRKTKSSKAQQYEEQVGRKLQVPIAELTYMGPNQKTVSNQNSSAGSSKIPPADWISENPEGKFYLSYSPPECKDNDPACKAILKQQADGMTDNHHARLFDVEGYHPILGSSIDPGICIMPHEPKLNMIVAGGMTYVDPQADLQLNPLVDTPYPELPNIQAYETWKSQQKELVKHNYDLLSSYEGVANQRHSIGLVYFNLNYLLTEYESMRYKVESQIADENKDPNQKTRVKVLRDDFSMFEFLDKIWKDVSKSCGNYYNFTLTTEHERPHVARVIDRTLSGYPKGEMFKFDPQGNYSITRDFEFSSKIDNDFADVVSIAAQSPSSINSLEAMSFKAFHKHIKSRFSDGSVDHQTEIAQMEEAKQKLKRDIQDYKHIVEQLYILLIRIQTGNFVTKLPWEKKTPEENQYIGTQTAVNYQAKLSELLNSIQSRYPLSDPRAGLYKSESSLNRNAVIPLTFSIKLDGISGILPLQLFQIKSNKLPEAYRSNKIAFIVSKEEHKITAGQDWETSIEGQLTMLNSYDGILGINEWEVEDHIEDYDGSTENELDGIEGDEGSPIPTGYNGSGLANPVHDWPADQNDIYFSSPWGRKRGPNVRHKGVDIAVASGTVVYSPAGGTVMEAFLPEDAGTGCGGTMTIKHDNGIKTRFCHLKEVYWTQGQTISGIMQIGLSGGAVGDIGRGSSEGAHLHYEVYANGTAWETPLPDWWPANVYTGTTDPAPFMAQANVSTYGTNPYGDN
jgi:murein DD-endopeptidase MepM/ murein hydrolase activator NlpD